MAVNPNLIDSDIFSSAKWQKSGQIEITPNYVTTPSFKRAHKLTNHNGDSDYLQYAPNSLPAGTYTLSIETKGETGNFTLEVDGPNWQGGAVITVNPTTGAVVTAARAYSNQTFVTAVSGKSFANPDTEKGGYIVSLTYTTSLAGAQPLLWPEAGKSVGVWGVKLENGTEATYATPGSPAVVEVPDEHDVRFVRHCGGIATADPNDTSGRAINDAALAQYYEVRKKFLVPASVLKMPVGYIHFSKTPRFINGFHHVKGVGGGIGGVDGTFIRVPGDQDGIQVDQANTNGLASIAGPAHESAAGSIFEGLGIWSMSNFGAKDPNTGLFVDPTYYRKRTGVTDPNDPTSGRSPASGILLRTRAIIRNCRITGFPGMGIYVIAADAWGWNGNANGWEVHSTRAEFCGDAGLYIIGGDANAGVATNFQAGYCGSWGVADLSYLGHSHIGHQVENNGWFANVETMAPYPTTCWFNGKIYLALARYDDADRKSAIYGQSTPGQSPGVWEEYYTPAPADNHPTTQTPEWIAGQNRQFIAGGAYAALSPVGASGFYDCYSEGGQNPSDYIGKSFAMGGLHAEGYNGVTKRSNPCYLNGVWTKAPGVAPQ
jgi:hypothetical protein